MAQKPSIPKGSRDFSPSQMAKRNYIFDIIKGIFQNFGFNQIETPAQENLSTLLGKYGDEGDKLLYKVLNSGDFLNKTRGSDLDDSNIFALQISKKGLRYDLTVPFARYVVQHQNEISFPFKRYQIQPVWRADRPQKGRYTEFFQCDADVIGSDSLLNEIDLIQIIDKVFTTLGIDVTIKLNNRKILAGITEFIDYPEKMTAITIAIDKLDKIGIDKVIEDLSYNGISKRAIDKLKPILMLSGSNNQKLETLTQLIGKTEIGCKGIEEITYIIDLLDSLNISNQLELDLSLARGLNYYTGAIIEVKSNDVQIGSICGGGRYDDLTGIFGLKDISGVGISFGADRIYDVLEELNKFPEASKSGTQLMFINFGDVENRYCLPILKNLREKNISSFLYPENSKLKKQFTFANNNNIKYVAITGEDEIQSGNITIKNMNSGEQVTIKPDTIESVIFKNDV